MTDDKFEINLNANPLPESTTSALLDPSAKVIGKGLSGIFHFLLGPLVKYSVVREAEIESFAEEINQKTQAVPPEHRDDSKFGLVLKTLEDSSYQLDSSTLREHFANLIAAIVDERVNNQVLPSFSSILKDMSPEDAKLLEHIYKTGALPVVELQLFSQFSRLAITYQSSIVLYENAPCLDCEVSVSSLQRLGLIEIQPNRKLAHEKFDSYHESFEQSDFLKSIKELLPMKFNGENYDLPRSVFGSINLSPYGEQFCRVVISGDRDPDSVLYPS